MAIIYVLIAVDTATLAQQVKDGSIKAGSQSRPTSLGSYDNTNVYITIITPVGNVSNNSQKQSDLTVNCTNSDLIQWAITSFSNNFDHSVSLYKVGRVNGFPAIKASYQSSQTNNYLPAPGEGASIGNITEYINQVASVQTKVIKRYALSFQLIDNSSGKTIGYFCIGSAYSNQLTFNCSL